MDVRGIGPWSIPQTVRRTEHRLSTRFRAFYESRFRRRPGSGSHDSATYKTVSCAEYHRAWAAAYVSGCRDDSNEISRTQNVREFDHQRLLS